MGKVHNRKRYIKHWDDDLVWGFLKAFMAENEDSTDDFKDWGPHDTILKWVGNGLRDHRRYTTGRHTKAEWEEKKKEHNYRCVYCGQVRKLTKDHLMPVSRGGTDDISNIVPACTSCNLKKHAQNNAEKISYMFPDMIIKVKND
jgi:5-methylcytosine-specific restriction endonuclease McrA